METSILTLKKFCGDGFCKIYYITLKEGKKPVKTMPNNYYNKQEALGFINKAAERLRGYGKEVIVIDTIK